MNKRSLVIVLATLSMCSIFIIGKLFGDDKVKGDAAPEPEIVLGEKEDFVNKEATTNIKYDELTENAIDDTDYSNVRIITATFDEAVNEDIIIAPDTEEQCLREDRGNSIPTLYWDLSASAYPYSISNMQSYVYTNRYFNASSNGEIRVTLDSFNSGGNNIYVRVYEVVTNNEVTHYYGNPELISYFTVINLPTNKMYYFKFEISGGTLSGSGTILHP